MSSGDHKRKKPSPAARLRSEFDVTSKLKPFYTGGRVSVCSSSQLAACACGEETRVVCLRTGQVVHSVPGDTAAVTAVCLGKGGKDLFVASRSLQVSHWDLETSTCKRRFRVHKSPVTHMCIDSQGMYLATAGSDNVVNVWDIQEGYLTHALKGHRGVVTYCVFHPHPRKYHLYTCGDDTTVKAWDLKTKKCKATLKAHMSTVSSLSVSPCGQFLLSCGQDSMAHCWRTDGAFQKVAAIPVNEVTNSAVFLASEAMRVSEGSEMFEMSKTAEKGGRPPYYFATVGQSGKVKIWNAQKFLCEHEFTVDDTCEKEGGCLDFAVLSSTRILCTTLDCRILLYDLNEAVEAFSRDVEARRPASFWRGLLGKSEQLVGNNEQITDLCFLGPKHLVIATNSQYIRIYDTETFSCLSSCPGHTDIVLALQAQQVGEGRFLIASGGKDNTLLLWDSDLTSDAALCGKAEGHFTAIESLAFANRKGSGAAASASSPFGGCAEYICSGDGDGFIKLWDMSWLSKQQRGQPVRRAAAGEAETPHAMSTVSTTAAHQKDVNTVAFSPDNSLLCTGSQDKVAKLWSVPSLAPVRTLRGHSRGVWSVAFSPIDQVVCTASGDKTMRLWSTQDGTCLRSFEGHTASILKICYVSLGTQLISAGADGLLKIWGVSDAECVNTLDTHEDKIWALDAIEEGNALASGSGDGEVFVWKDYTSERAQEERRAEAELITKKQKIADAMHKGSYAAAFRLALDLKFPAQLHRIIRKAARPEAGHEEARFWSHVVESLTDDDLKECLRYAAEWNTNSKLYLCSHLLLENIFGRVHPDRLAGISGLDDTWQGLASYSQRHAKRIDTLLRSTYMLDYALASGLNHESS